MRELAIISGGAEHATLIPVGTSRMSLCHLPRIFFVWFTIVVIGQGMIMSEISIQKFFVILSVLNSNGGGPSGEAGLSWTFRTQPSLVILCSAERGQKWSYHAGVIISPPHLPMFMAHYIQKVQVTLKTPRFKKKNQLYWAKTWLSRWGIFILIHMKMRDSMV